MVSLKKYVPCKCGSNSYFEFNSDMSVEDISVSARCPSCGASVSISVSSLLSSPTQPPQPQFELPGIPAGQEPLGSGQDKETRENVEQAVRDLFR